MNDRHDSIQVNTIVIGGGQAGLSVGYYLAKQGIPFRILDGSRHIGDAWRNRWDSLRLFNPARYAGLPGMPFPGPGDSFPTKNQMATYLADYAHRFQLPVRSGVIVDRLWKENGRYVMTSGRSRFEAENVVIAMSNYQAPKVPTYARDLDPGIVQLHSQSYRNQSQLREGGVLVVGSGNSGAEIALESSRAHRTWIAGKESGHVPWPIETFVSRHFLSRLIRFIGHHVLTVKTPIGRKARPKLLHTAAPLVRIKPKDLDNAGIEHVAKVTGAKDGLPLLADGRTLDVKNVIWCTGFHHGFPWIELPIFGEDGDVIHDQGIVKPYPGLYFVGLHFLYAMSSATLMGVARDAERIVSALASRKPVAESSNIRRVA